jgi:hypothetical protein
MTARLAACKEPAVGEPWRLFYTDNRAAKQCGYAERSKEAAKGNNVTAQTESNYQDAQHTLGGAHDWHIKPPLHQPLPLATPYQARRPCPQQE